MPRKLFSETAKPSVPPEVPNPAPSDISPVAFSSTSISINFELLSDPSVIFDTTFANRFLAFRLLIDLFYNG